MEIVNASSGYGEHGLDLESVIAERLHQLGFDIADPGAPSGGTVDLRARWPDGDLEFDVEVRSGPATASLLVGGMGGEGPPRRILAFPHVTAGVGERLRASGTPYVDSGGNAWITGPGLHILVEGRRSSVMARPAREKIPRAFRPAGLRVLFVLLCAPRLLNVPQREIAAASGVSLGAVSNTLRGLEQSDLLGVSRKQRILRDPAALARTWMEHYVSTLRPVLSQRRVDGPDVHWWAGEDAAIVVHDAGLQFGGETAIARQSTLLRAEETVLYGEPPWSPILRTLRMRTAPEGRVLLLERFWDPAALGDSLDVPPLLVYADALASGDERQIEVAERVYVEDHGRDRVR